MARAAQRTCTSATGRQAGGQVGCHSKAVRWEAVSQHSSLSPSSSSSSSSPLLPPLLFFFFFLVFPSSFWVRARGVLCHPCTVPVNTSCSAGPHVVEGGWWPTSFFFFSFLFFPSAFSSFSKAPLVKGCSHPPPIHPTTAPVHRTKQLTQQAAI